MDYSVSGDHCRTRCCPRAKNIKNLVQQVYQNTLYGGVQLMMSHLGRTMWITRSKPICRAVTRSCPRCVRFAARTEQQQMAPLPSARITPQWPFTNTGLDYAGPISVRYAKERGIRASKGYIAIFICLVTRAVHVEIVSNLANECFLAAYNRCTSRRGHCRIIYSDNATTFKDAAAEIERLFQATSTLTQEVASQIAKDGTTWKFIPPRASHFGGLWEAAVRSFKHHFLRVVGDSALTFEELTTRVLIRDLFVLLATNPLILLR